MPVVTRWFIKAGLVYVVAALLLGVVLAAPAVLPVPPAVAVWGPVYFTSLWSARVTQLIFGVVY
jgi:hypothetical protein